MATLALIVIAICLVVAFLPDLIALAGIVLVGALAIGVVILCYAYPVLIPFMLVGFAWYLLSEKKRATEASQRDAAWEREKLEIAKRNGFGSYQAYMDDMSSKADPFDY